MKIISRSAARAGLWARAIAFIADLFLVSMITSLNGVWLAGATGGSVRVGEVIGSRIHCTGGRTTPTEFELPPNTKIHQVARCTKEFLGVPYDWSLDIRAQIQENDGVSSVRVITVPLDPAGRATSAFYLDSLVMLVFGVYAFLTEWRFGATLGKRLLGIRVRSLARAPIDSLRAAKRAMMRMAAFAPPMAVTACATGSVTFAWWLFEHPAWKIVGGVVIALWSIAFAANFVVATTRRALPWHDQWAGTEAILQRNDRKPREIDDLPRRSPVPLWLVRRQDNR